MPLNIDIQQILLHLLNFAILFCALYFLLYRPVKKFMDHRNDEIEEKLSEAERKMAEAEKMKADYEKRMTAFNESAAYEHDHILSSAREEAEGIRSSAQADAGRIVSRAKEEAEREHDEIIRKVQDDIRSLAYNTAKNIIMDDSREAYDRFLSEEADGRKEKPHG